MEINDLVFVTFEKDNEVIQKVNDMLVEIGAYEPEAEPSDVEKVLNVALKGLNDVTYIIFGAKGFVDFELPKLK